MTCTPIIRVEVNTHSGTAIVSLAGPRQPINGLPGATHLRAQNTKHATAPEPKAASAPKRAPGAIRDALAVEPMTIQQLMVATGIAYPDPIRKALRAMEAAGTVTRQRAKGGQGANPPDVWQLAKARE